MLRLAEILEFSLMAIFLCILVSVHSEGLYSSNFSKITSDLLSQGRECVTFIEIEIF